MHTPHLSVSDRRRRTMSVLLVSLCIALALLVASVPLSVMAVKHRLITPPTFALRLGRIEIAAPCPTRGFECFQPLPWYAIWWSEERPDGVIHSEQLYFLYLTRERKT